MTLIIGRITQPSGAPAAGVWVYAYPDGARFGQVSGVHTDIAGRWRLDLAPGRWTIRETSHHTHDVTVGDHPLDLAAPPQVAAPAPAPGDIARLRARRRNRTTLEG